MEPSRNNSVQRINLSPWKQGFEIISQLKAKMVYLSLVGMAIPLTVFEVQQGTISQDFSNNFRSINGTLAPVEFFQYIAAIGDYIGQYGLSWVLMSWVLMPSYFIMVSLSCKAFDKDEDNLRGSTIEALKAVIPKGIIASILLMTMMFFFSFLSVGLLGPIAQFILLIGLSLSCAVPFLILNDKRRPLSAVWGAIKMNYAPNIRGMKWSIFFQLSSTQLFLIAIIISLAAAKHYIVDIDVFLNFPRDSWFSMSPWLPFSWTYLLAHFIYTFLVGIAVMGFAAVTSTFFMMIKKLV